MVSMGKSSIVNAMGISIYCIWDDQIRTDWDTTVVAFQGQGHRHGLAAACEYLAAAIPQNTRILWDSNHPQMVHGIGLPTSFSENTLFFF